MSNCAFCKGKLEQKPINHVLDLGKQIIIVKNVPANYCTQCGESFIEHPVALQLEKIVEQLKNSHTEIAITNYLDQVA